jgi:hypothetical protein
MVQLEPHDVPKHEDHWANYVEYNKTLRTWFVTFGIGGPVLLLLNPSLLAALKDDGRAPWVVALFLTGCALQVVIALINKTVSWYMYCGEQNSTRRAGRWYGHCEKVSESYWIDLTFDILTIFAFGAAIWFLIDINLRDILPFRSPSQPR